MEHDWQSESYVEEWINRDVQRDNERRPLLRQMLALAQRAADSELAIIDVGGGYGIVSEEILKAFPRARVTLQDYSQPMLKRARVSLAAHAGQVEYLLCDLTDPSWAEEMGKSFDLAVSAIALHNLRDLGLIEQAYRSINRVLKPSGLFLNCDLFEYVGGVQTHVSALERLGFSAVECPWQQPPLAIIKAQRSA